jgi:hypothetical protein
MRAFAVVLATLAISAISQPSKAETPVSSKTIRDWTFKAFADGSSGAQTVNESGSTLGVYCLAEQQCTLFLQAETKCEPDAKYPLMVNADSGAIAVSTTCNSYGSAGAKDSFALFFDDFQSIFNIVLKNHTIGFSIPMANGMFKVTRFSLEGSNEVMAAVSQSIKGKGGAKPAGLKDQVL